MQTPYRRISLHCKDSRRRQSTVASKQVHACFCGGLHASNSIHAYICKLQRPICVQPLRGSSLNSRGVDMRLTPVHACLCKLQRSICAQSLRESSLNSRGVDMRPTPVYACLCKLQRPICAQSLRGLSLNSTGVVDMRPTAVIGELRLSGLSLVGWGANRDWRE